MSTIRYFSGGREAGKRSVASNIKRVELQKRGKFSNADRQKFMLNAQKQLRQLNKAAGMQESNNERFKRLLKEKLEQHKEAAQQGGSSQRGFHLAGTKPANHGRSKRAEEALKQMAMKKAAKEEKAMRRMVLVTPKTFSNGKITKKGRIYDVADNLVGQVNTKNGKIFTMGGMSIGKYKGGSYMTNLLIQDTINRYSPYFINLRKMQAMQQGQGVWGANPSEDVINIMGSANTANRNGIGGPFAGGVGAPFFAASTPGGSLFESWGTDVVGPRQNVGVTAWGAMSDNAWGTFADNAWGVSADNVWGGTNSNIWGGLGVGGGWWGWRGPNIFGTGNGKNYLKKITGLISSLFGIQTKASRERLLGVLSKRKSSSGGGFVDRAGVRFSGSRDGGSTRTGSSPRTGGSGRSGR